MNKRPGLLVLSSLVATLAGQAAAVEVEQRSLSQDAPPARPAATQPAAPAVTPAPVRAVVAAPVVVPRPVAPTPAAAPANPAWDMFQQLDSLQATVARLQGQLEEQQQLVDRLKEDLKIRYTDLDQRLEQLSQKPAAPAAPAVTEAPAAAPVLPVAPAIPVPTPIVETPATPVVPVAPVIAAETPAPAIPVAPAKPAATPIRQDVSVEEIEKQKQAYLTAYQRFRSNGPAAAITAMTGFTQKFPDSVFSPNAHYWLGEFQLASEPANYAAAEASFKRVISDYDGSPKVASAYYKLGTIADLRGQRDEARRWMNELLSRFPSSPEARLAQSFLDQNPAGAAKPKG